MSNSEEINELLDEKLDSLPEDSKAEAIARAVAEAVSKAVPAIQTPQPNRHERRRALNAQKNRGRGYTKSPKPKRRKR